MLYKNITRDFAVSIIFIILIYYIHVDIQEKEKEEKLAKEKEQEKIEQVIDNKKVGVSYSIAQPESCAEIL